MSDLAAAETKAAQAVADLDRYAGPVQQEKRAQAAAIRESAKQAAIDEVQEWQEEAARLRLLGHRSMMTELSPSELDAANRLAPFIREDAQTMTLVELTDQLKAELAHGDNASRALHLRYGKQRLEAWRAEAQRRASNPNSNTTPQEPGARELEAALTELAAKLVTPARAGAATRAQEIADASAEIRRVAGRLASSPSPAVPGLRL